MSKFAIRLLTLAMFVMALVAAPLLPAYAARRHDPLAAAVRAPSKAKKKKRQEFQHRGSASSSRAITRPMPRSMTATIMPPPSTQLKALGHDDNAAVANLIGYSYRKLGDYKVSQIWYERALQGRPDHVKTWQYYGLWQVEQGNRDQAQYHLSRIAALAGTDSEEYRSLAAALEKPPGTGLVY